MPLPAGTGLDRRTFLARSAGLALGVYGASKLSFDLLDEGIARAATARPAGFSSRSSSTEEQTRCPSSSPAETPCTARSGLSSRSPSRQAQAFAEDSRLRWHPAAAPLAALHAEGKLTTMPAVGYTDPDQSHFTSRHYWEVGATSSQLRTGWLGRYLDRVGAPDNPLQGLSLDWQLQPSLATSRVPVATMDSPDGYDFWARGVWGEVEDRMLADDRPARGRTAAHRSQDRVGLRRLRVQVDQPSHPAGGVRRVHTPGRLPGGRRRVPETSLGPRRHDLRGSPTPLRRLRAPGAYDTHDDQVAQLEQGLALTSQSLLAFQRDLEARGIADRVVTRSGRNSVAGPRRTAPAPITAPRARARHGLAGSGR